MLKLNIKPGDTFGKLYIIKELERIRFPSGQTKRVFKCKCTCKDKTILNVTLGNLKSGNTLSCGCFAIEELKARDKSKHGLSKHPLYRVYQNMISRCYNSKNKQYKDYGGRGITVCKEWINKNEYKGLLEFFKWNDSLLKEKQWNKGLQLDRKNNNGNYKPSNCHWVTNAINCNNRRTTVKYEYKGKLYTIKQLHTKYGNKNLKEKTIQTRISRGWEPIIAVNKIVE